MDKYSTWNKLVESLTQAFEVPGDRELATVKQGTLSINEFARKLRTIGDYAYESVPANVREGLLVNHFIHHTNRYIRNKLLQIDSTPKTLEEIIRTAERLQRLLELEEDKDGEELIAAIIWSPSSSLPARNLPTSSPKSTQPVHPLVETPKATGTLLWFTATLRKQYDFVLGQNQESSLLLEKPSSPKEEKPSLRTSQNTKIGIGG
ncbi:hypothetical protein GCK72_011147 [Caenorhabditis remanei]|uniref:Retrotransposon gag domain-containing protein n=1 Tax=Caenorhabditis remanei TaxID=31234 RepID=A0A6A5H8Y1_CAERE|nr:hypothetical protein GCK72_011147 [Caenorhabditis remanei]KAF1762883.1 hypothetical protein GCK72_011147 [Caenorhabditis remanei]